MPSAITAPATPMKFSALPANRGFLLIFKDGSSGWNDTRLSATRTAVVSSNNPTNSFHRRCPEGTRKPAHLLLISGKDSNGIQTRMRDTPQYLAQFGNKQTPSCCLFANTPGES